MVETKTVYDIRSLVETHRPAREALALRLEGAVHVEVVQLREAVAAGGGHAERHAVVVSAQLHGGREHGHGWRTGHIQCTDIINLRLGFFSLFFCGFFVFLRTQ